MLTDFLEQEIKEDCVIYWTRGGNSSSDRPVQCMGVVTRITEAGSVFAKVHKTTGYRLVDEVRVGRPDSILVINEDTAKMVLFDYVKNA